MRFAVALILVLAGAGARRLAARPDARRRCRRPGRTSLVARQVRPKYGGWTGVFDQLQLFTIFNSIWFRVIMMVLTISVVACSVQRMPGVWRTATRPRVDVERHVLRGRAPARIGGPCRGRRLPCLRRSGRCCARHRYRTIVHDDGTVHIYADRNRWAPVGSLAGHLSLVVIIAGALVGSTFGYRDGQFMITEGTTAAVPTENGLTVKLDAFRDSYYAETGAPADYASDLVLYQGGVEVARQTVRVNQPLRYGDMSFYQAFYGPAALMTVSNSGGTQLASGGVPLAWDAPDGQRQMGSLTLPDQGLTAWVIGTTGPDDPIVKPGQVHLEIYSTSNSATPVAVRHDHPGPARRSLPGSRSCSTGKRSSRASSLVKDPGAPLVWLGGLMLVLGVVAVSHVPAPPHVGPARGPARRRFQPGIASVGRHDSNFDAEFAKLVNEVRGGGRRAAASS